LIETVWTEAAFLILPAMVIEDINIKDAIKRASQVIKDNLLLVGISTVGVKAVTGLIGFLLGALGIGLGFGVGLGIISASQESVAGLIAGISLGILLATPFIMAAVVISTYTSTAYHTCLYLWARDVERSRQAGQAIDAKAPSPLAAVLP
jgi:small-conductance mechanosensitive channel